MMPDYKTQARGVLDKVGADGLQISKWANPLSDTQIWCNLCAKPVSVDHSGISQVNQHIKPGTTHYEKARQRFSTSQPKFEPVGDGAIKYVKKTPELRKIEAEALWSFKIAEEDWSFTSSDDTNTLFKRMFGEEAVKSFSVGHTKLSYIVRHGISNALLQDLVSDINASVGTYTLMLDETTTAQVKKQCDFLAKYWSEQENEVVTRYITSEFFAHTSAKHLQELVVQVLGKNDVEVEKLANLALDGPNINKSLHQSLHNHLTEGTNHPGLMPWNPCVLHKVHTGYHNGIMEYGHDVENMAFDLHSWFKISPCKREDFVMVTVDFQSEIIFAVFNKNESLFYRHVETRWLTLVPALEKVEQRWLSAKKYFLEYLPSTKDFSKSTASNKRYSRIVSIFQKENTILIQLAFVIDVSSPYTSFLTEFQSAGPKIHVLYQSMKQLVSTLMLRFLKPELVNGLNGKDLQKLDVSKVTNHLDIEKMEVGAKAKRLLKEMTPYDRKKEKEKMLNFYVTSVKFLQKKLPFDNMILAAATCLHPDNRNHSKSIDQISFLATTFRHVIAENQVSRVKDEWKMYQAEIDIDNTKCRIDHYWRKIFEYKLPSGETKYPNLSILIKSVLSLHHGNSDVERSLSDNKNTCTKERTELNEETLVGLRRMKEHARNVGGAENVIVTPAMVAGMKNAWKVNNERIAKENKDKELAELKLQEVVRLEKEQKEMINEADLTKKSLEQKEQSYTESEEKFTDELLLAKRILDDGSKKLSEALAKKDMIGVQVANELITSAQQKLSSTEEKRKTQEKERAVIGMKRKMTIESMFTKIKTMNTTTTVSKSSNKKVDDMFSKKTKICQSSSETLTKPVDKVIHAEIKAPASSANSIKTAAKDASASDTKPKIVKSKNKKEDKQANSVDKVTHGDTKEPASSTSIKTAKDTSSSVTTSKTAKSKTRKEKKLVSPPFFKKTQKNSLLSESVTKHGDKEDRNGKKSVLAKATDITSGKEEMKEEAHDTENSKLKRKDCTTDMTIEEEEIEEIQDTENSKLKRKDCKENWTEILPNKRIKTEINTSSKPNAYSKKNGSESGIKKSSADKTKGGKPKAKENNKVKGSIFRKNNVMDLPPFEDKNISSNDESNPDCLSEQPSSSCHFNISPAEENELTPSQFTPHKIEEFFTDKWVIVRLQHPDKTGKSTFWEYYVGQILEVFTDVEKASIRCLENAYGVGEPQDFEATRFWKIPYPIKDIFVSPVTPTSVKSGRGWKWQY